MTVIINIQLQEQLNSLYFRTGSLMVWWCTKVRGLTAAPLCTLNFPHSVGAVVTSEGARHTLASM